MGWEERNGNRYYYRKHRFGDKVISEYIGTGPFAEAVASLEETIRAEEQRLRDRVRARLETDREIDRILDEIGAYIRAYRDAVLLINGYHTHKGQWRKRKN